ncbi:MAG: hypothetical protein JCHSAcid_08020 [uncultured Acidilobus sp. JCHS]|jgi:hypothetical protein|nr:MAG: hypothetical protein JCHSAcid_08020 [uncultured Acidilobus sp. JCHS]MCI4460249.1 hypothetical protein [Acidilobus sp.]MDT7867880.1 hypothetical protein [Acidianus sp.]NAZ39485.1 hypothetical protein [Acidilobus sp.]
MSEYLSEVKDLLQKEATKYDIKVEVKGKNVISISKGGAELMSIRDADDNVEITYKGQKYVYDKWYTKPQHLAQVVFNVLNASSQK